MINKIIGTYEVGNKLSCPDCLVDEEYKFSLNDRHEDWDATDATKIYQCPKCKRIDADDDLWNYFMERQQKLTQNPNRK